MTQAVASSDAMRSLIVRMASATDDELKDIANHVAMAAYKILDAVSENPFTQLFDPKGAEIQQQRNNLVDAIDKLSASFTGGRQSIIDACTYLQATIETTNAFYGDNDAWSAAIGQFSADLTDIAEKIVEHAIVPALAPWISPVWHKFRWYIIGLSLALAIVLVISLRKGVSLG